MQKEKILIVDDDPNVLAACKRMLSRAFDAHTAENGLSGLKTLRKDGPFSVVVSDRSMPEMDGIQFLRRAMETDAECVRIMLTGNADLESAVDSVNKGHVFRFLTKPCRPETLAGAINAGIRQHRLIRAEKELLEETLNGSVQLMSELLSIVDPVNFTKTIHLRDFVELAARTLNLKESWDVQIAAMLSQIGRVAVSRKILSKERLGERLEKEEKEALDRIPEIGHQLLSNIPRLEGVAKIVLYQNKNFDGSGFPPDGVEWEEIPFGARMLKALADLIRHESRGTSFEEAVSSMKSEKNRYYPTLISFIEMKLLPYGNEIDPASIRPMDIGFESLQLGDIFLSNLETLQGKILMGFGSKATMAAMERLRNYKKLVGLKEPFRVGRPMAMEAR